MSVEQQLLDLVKRATSDEQLRKELVENPGRVCQQEGLPSLAERVVMQMVPHLTLAERSLGVTTPTWTWWY